MVVVRRLSSRSIWAFGFSVWALSSVVLQTALVRGDELVQVDGVRIAGVVQSLDGANVTILPNSKGEAAKMSPITLPLADLETIEFIPPASPLIRSRMLVENLDGTQVTTVDGAIKLKQGTHQMNLTYWQNDGPAILNVEMEGPDLPRKPLANDFLLISKDYTKLVRSKGNDADGFRLPDVSPASTNSRVSYWVKEWSHGSDMQSLGDLRAIPSERSGSKSGLNLGLKRAARNFAVTFQFLFSAPVDGEYRFFVESFGQATLSVGALPAIEQLSPSKPTKDLWVIQTRGDGRIVGRLKSGSDGKIHLEMLITPVGIEMPFDESWLTDAWRVAVETGEQVVDRSGEPTDSDSVYATGNNDQVQRVSGKILGIDGEKLRFEYNGTERAVQLDKVVGIVKAKGDMAAADANATPATGVTGTILLPRQQRLPGVISELRGDGTAMVSLAWGQAVSIKRSDMIRQAFRGGRLQWLSDLTPERVEETPFFDRVIHWRRDESLTGTTMQMGNRYYRKGVSQHSRSRLTYRLDGQYARFQSDVGLLLPGGADGNAAVRLLLDDVVAFELAEVAAGNSPNPQVIDLDLRGKQTLTLEVDFGKDYDVADHVGWGNAKLLKAKPE